ncbi:MAG: hypothetical protein KAI81_04390 [Candidatus Marinimicrobia bacterium]|nr:hypothetical protein [Candidatus Neomarinimicrobiota bacterium]
MIFKHKCPIPGCNRQFPDKRGLDIHMKEFHVQSTESQLPGNLESQIKQKGQNVDNNLISTKEFTKLSINLNYHVFISGQTGTGKSVVGKFIFASLPKKEHAVFIDIKHDPDNQKFIDHFPVFTSLDEIKKHYESDKEGFINKKQKDMRVIYRPSRVKSESTKTHSLENPNWQMFQDLCDWAYEKGNIILFVDEAAVFSTPQNIVPAAYEIMILGRSRAVIMVNLSQRPASIHNCLISEAYTRILLRSELESDRIKLKGIVGENVSNQLHGLPNQEFILSYINGKNEKGHITLPKNLKWIIR